MRRIVVVQWSRLGDIVQTRPLLRHIAGHRAGAQIMLCADVRYQCVAERIPECADFWPVDLERLSNTARHPQAHATLMQDLLELGNMHDHDGITDVYVLTRSLAACVFAESLHPAHIFGYRRHGPSVQAPQPIRLFEENCAAGARTPVQLADLWTCLDGTQRTPQWLPPLAPANTRCSADGPVRVGVFCDAGSEARTIPDQWQKQLVSALHSRDAEITLLGAAPSNFSSGASDVIDKRGKTSLKELMDELASQNCVIGPDTGGLHLASSLGIPVIGLYFGGASCLNTGFYSPNALAIENPVWDIPTGALVADTATRAARGASSYRLSDTAFCKPVLNEQGLCYFSEDWPNAARSGIQAAQRAFFESLVPSSHPTRAACSA